MTSHCRWCAFAESSGLPRPHPQRPVRITDRAQDEMEKSHQRDVAVNAMTDEEYAEYLASPASAHRGQHPWPCPDCGLDGAFEEIHQRSAF
jgi:hypothetical protein